MIDINLTAAWNTVRATVPRVLDTGQGEEIVFTTSVLGLKGMPNVTHHTAAKHGMTGLMRALAIELAPHRVRVNAVVPTQTLTPMIDIPADYRALRLDLDAPTQADFAEVSLLTRTYPEPLGAPGGHHGGGLVARVGRGSILSPGSTYRWTVELSSSENGHSAAKGCSRTTACVSEIASRQGRFAKRS